MKEQFILQVWYPGKKGYDFEYIQGIENLIRSISLVSKADAKKIKVYCISKITEFTLSDNEVEIDKLFRSPSFYH